MNDLQRQYEGWRSTPLLWEDSAIADLSQLVISGDLNTSFQESIPDKIRLGMLIERFVHHELKTIDSIELLASNIQINRDGITLGELDALISGPNYAAHIEIVYKFYLYDPTLGKKDLDKWIGPNRKDSLVEKLNKLTKKQLPLLYKDETKSALQKMGISVDELKQYVHFKAQLFPPYTMRDEVFTSVNTACINGYYLRTSELTEFENCKFYIPEKHNWLCKPHTNFNWDNYGSFYAKIGVFHSERRSPMCWIKHPNGHIEKIFVVWW